MRVPNFVDVFFGMDRGVVGVHLIRLKFGGIFLRCS